VEIVKQVNEINEDGSYTVGYEASDGTFKLETRDTDGNVEGTPQTELVATRPLQGVPLSGRGQAAGDCGDGHHQGPGQQPAQTVEPDLSARIYLPNNRIQTMPADFEGPPDIIDHAALPGREEDLLGGQGTHGCGCGGKFACLDCWPSLQQPNKSPQGQQRGGASAVSGLLDRDQAGAGGGGVGGALESQLPSIHSNHRHCSAAGPQLF